MSAVQFSIMLPLYFYVQVLHRVIYSKNMAINHSSIITCRSKIKTFYMQEATIFTILYHYKKTVSKGGKSGLGKSKSCPKRAFET